MFFNSTGPDITESIPTPLSGGGLRALEQARDDIFDLSVNGIPFNLRVSTYSPYKREGEPVRKEQFDSSTEAGEQSLSTWWIRSQASWHMGAGIRYYDPGAEQETEHRFASSQGVDVWEPGQVTLLNSMTPDQTGLTEPVYLSTFRSGGRDGWVSASGDRLYWRGGEAPGGTLVRTNVARNPRMLFQGDNPFILGSTTGTGEVPTVGGPLGHGYRGLTTTNATQWGFYVSDRDVGANANEIFSYFEEGDDVITSGYIYASWSGVNTIQGTIELVWYGAGGAVVSTKATSRELPNGEWTRLLIRDEMPAGATHFRTKIRWDATNVVPIGGVARAADVLTEKQTELLPWFDGETTDTATHVYAWLGAANATPSTDTYTPGTDTTLGSAQASQPAAVGNSVYVGHADAISKWNVDTDVLTEPYTTSGPARCWWVKNRLFVAVGKDLYWVNHNGTGTIPDMVGDDTLLVASGVDDAWEWVDVTDTADAILLAGAGETASGVFAITITTDDAVPVFTSAREVARLPFGEQASCLGSYLSSFVVLGTTKGVRVGAIGEQGAIQLGGLTVELTVPPVDVTFFDRFAYLPVTTAQPDGTSGVVRIDLSTEIVGKGGGTGLFPWAWDVYPGGVTDTATSVALNGNTGKVVLAVGGQTYVTSDAFLESGYFDSGLIRYRTTEMKDFQRARLSGGLNGGRVKLSGLINGTESSIYTYGATTGLEGEAVLNLPGGPLFAELAFRVRLERVGALSPMVNGMSVKAMPAVTKSRLIQYPLSLYDRETSRHGNDVGYKGFGYDRVMELEELENRGAAVRVYDSRYEEQLVATIESLAFTNFDPPDGELDNGGGTLLMTVRVR